MNIEAQLRHAAQRAEQAQRTITAAEVVQRHESPRPLFTSSSQFNGYGALHGDQSAPMPEESHNMIDLEVPSTSHASGRGPKRIVAIALLAAASITALALVAFRSNDAADPGGPADQPSPTVTATSAASTAAPTTSAPAVSAPPTSAPAMSDLEVIEAAANAFYSGDAERAAELFELRDRTDDEIRAESAYQATIRGRATVSCTEQSQPGTFRCTTPYYNALTEAVGEGGGNDQWPVVVRDGVVTEYGFTEHTGLLLEMATFLAAEDRFDGFEDCINGPFPESCGVIIMDNVDAWAEWRATLAPADRVDAVLESWFRGDCDAAVRLSWGADSDCTPSSWAAGTTAYETILGARVSLENCAVSPPDGNHTTLSCEVQYSNVMNDAVGAPPSVTAREFLLIYGQMTAGPDEAAWYTADYPGDTELRDSFRLFAEGGELADEFAAAECGSARSPECADLIVANLEPWAAWYASNA